MDNREPEGRGHEILKVWALYRRGGERSHSPVTSGSWDEPLDVAYDGEPDWVVKVDGALADIVQLPNVGPMYEQMLKRYYLSNQAVWDIAEKMLRTQGFVLISLKAICSHVENKLPGLDLRNVTG